MLHSLFEMGLEGNDTLEKKTFKYDILPEFDRISFVRTMYSKEIVYICC